MHVLLVVTHFVTLQPHGQVSNVRWRPFILSDWGIPIIKCDFRDNIYLSPEPHFVFTCPGSLPHSNVMLVMYFIHFLPLRSIQPSDNESNLAGYLLRSTIWHATCLERPSYRDTHNSVDLSPRRGPCVKISQDFRHYMSAQQITSRQALSSLTLGGCAPQAHYVAWGAHL